jgi:hypothetical protein
MLSGVTDPLFVLQRIDANGNPYPFTLQARNQTEFTTADFETVWNLLLSHPNQPFGNLVVKIKLNEMIILNTQSSVYYDTLLQMQHRKRVVM